MGNVVDQALPPIAASGWRVWGHDSVVASLQRAVVSGPRHAYVLTGPDHIGKRLLADEFALALNCPTATATGIPCRVCALCKRIDRGVLPDVSVFDLDRQARVESGTGKNTTLTIDTVRAIGHELSLRPSEAPWRVVIVDDMESMQETAQEAFLKTLEEPPASAVLLLLTSDIESLLETVLSRCVVVTLPLVSTAVIDCALQAAGVAATESTGIADLSRGLPGWAFSAANHPSMLDARREMRDEARAWIGGDAYDRMVRAIRTADRFSQNRDGVAEALVTVMLEWRHLLYQAVGLTAGTNDEPSMTTGNAGYLVPELVRAIASVRDCLADLDANVRPRLASESMVLQWPTAR